MDNSPMGRSLAPAGAKEEGRVLDPVCGMAVDPATAAAMALSSLSVIANSALLKRARIGIRQEARS